MAWCFAIVNNRLAEIYFRELKGRLVIFWHCYVERKEYRTKRELKWIREDTAKFRFIYRKGRYKVIKTK